MAKEDKSQKLETMRHSASHIMAEAVQSLFPEAKFGIGPAIEDGFYYDFDLPRPLGYGRPAGHRSQDERDNRRQPAICV